jgi:hypothetical protein
MGAEGRIFTERKRIRTGRELEPQCRLMENARVIGHILADMRRYPDSYLLHGENIDA